MEPGPGAMRAWGPSGGGRWGRVSSLPFLAALCLLTAPASATLGAGVQPAGNNSRWDLAEVLGVGCPGAHGGGRQAFSKQHFEPDIGARDVIATDLPGANHMPGLALRVNPRGPQSLILSPEI